MAALSREVLLIFVLLIAIAVLAKAVDFFSVNVDPGDAATFVLEDLKVKYPEADISILKTSYLINNATGEKYFEVKAKVTQGSTTPCPKRVHIYYNYPVQNFVPQPPDVITQSCTVCTEGTCILNFPEEAIIASHTFSGTEDVSAYLVQASAKPTAQDNEDYWRVSWDAKDALSYYNVDISKSGKILNVTKMVKGLS
jgi:hypothetical protein